jgi:signal transduction histidine kinase
MKMKKNQVKVELKPNTNIICTLWTVIWPFEHYVFKRRINIFLVMNLQKNKDMVADWNLYELVFYNILQNALKYNKNVDGDIVITMTCRKARIQNQNSESQKYMLETQVIDSGVGIEPSRHKLLFIPF